LAQAIWFKLTPQASQLAIVPTASHRMPMPRSTPASPWSEMRDEHMAAHDEAPMLLIETPPASSEADEQAEDGDYSDFDEDEAAASPSSTRKRRTRRRRRHGKNKASTSTASTASGGGSFSEDDCDGKSPQDRGVVTWRDLGLGLGLNSKSGDRSHTSRSGRLAVARCEMAGHPLPMPPPPPANAPDILRDASERTVPSSPFGRQAVGSPWFPMADASPGVPPPHAGWGASWHLAEPPTIAVPTSPWGSVGGAVGPPMASTPMGAASDRFGMLGIGSCPCSPTGASSLGPPPAPTPTPSAAAAKEVPSWLRGYDMPIGGEDLAQKLRAVAPDTYED